MRGRSGVEAGLHGFIPTLVEPVHAPGQRPPCRHPRRQSRLGLPPGLDQLRVALPQRLQPLHGEDLARDGPRHGRLGRMQRRQYAIGLLPNGLKPLCPLQDRGLGPRRHLIKPPHRLHQAGVLIQLRHHDQGHFDPQHFQAPQGRFRLPIRCLINLPSLDTSLLHWFELVDELDQVSTALAADRQCRKEALPDRQAQLRPLLYIFVMLHATKWRLFEKGYYLHGRLQSLFIMLLRLHEAMQRL